MFKVGDQVKVICDHPVGGWGPFVKKGDVGVMSKIRDDGSMLVDFPNHLNWVGHLKEFELVAPTKKLYTLADLKGTGVDAQLKASAADKLTLRKLRNRVVYNLNNMEKFRRHDDEPERLANINTAFSWRDSPEGGWLWAGVFYGLVVKFEDIPARPHAKKVQAPAAPAQPRADVPAPAAPVVEKKVEAPVKKEPAKKVGWW